MARKDEQQAWAGRQLRNLGRSMFPLDGKPLEAEPRTTVPLSPSRTAPNPAIERLRGNTGLSQLGTPTVTVAEPANAGGSGTKPSLVADTITPKVNPVNALARQQLAGTPGQSLNAPSVSSPPIDTSKPFKSLLSSGITYEGDTQGNRTYSMGTPGQDGYGRMTVKPGSAPQNSAARLLASGIKQPGDGYEVSGPQDAVARFNRPVSNPGNPAPDALNGGSRAAMLEQQSAQQRLASTPQAPKYMTREEGAAAGVGWKGRGQIYAQQMDAYNKATGNQNALDVEQMREGGAGARAMLAAQGINDRNAIDREGQLSANEIARKRLGGELALNDVRIGTERIGQQKGQTEIEALQAQNAARDEYMKNPTPENEQKYRAAVGKFEKEAQFGTVGKYDDQGMKVGEDLYNKQTGELRSWENQDPAMSIIESNPNYKQAYQSADPKKQQEMIKALRERMAQGSK